MTGSMYPDNIIGLMFKILDSATQLANVLVSNLMKTPVKILDGWLTQNNVPDWLRVVIEQVLQWNSPLIANITLFEFLVGTALVFVLIVGIAKYFGDLFGL